MYRSLNNFVLNVDLQYTDVCVCLTIRDISWPKDYGRSYPLSRCLSILCDLSCSWTRSLSSSYTVYESLPVSSCLFTSGRSVYLGTLFRKYSFNCTSLICTVPVLIGQVQGYSFRSPSIIVQDPCFNLSIRLTSEVFLGVLVQSLVYILIFVRLVVRFYVQSDGKFYENWLILKRIEESMENRKLIIYNPGDPLYHKESSVVGSLHIVIYNTTWIRTWFSSRS